MENKNLKIHLKIWRQENKESKGRFESYSLNNVNPDMSFLEMLDILNEDIINQNGDPIEFDNDCREGICGMCGLVINGTAHGPRSGTTTCELRMREFEDGDTIVVEPWRAKAFPVLKDLAVDRSAFDRIIAKGGFITVRTGGAPEARSILVKKENADEAMDMAACIGCGACVAACPNASAALFVGAKISHFALLPQGHPEAKRRAERMVAQMDEELFGACSRNYLVPAQITVNVKPFVLKKFLSRQ
jgi:succinate dehydrogenase / fumarate reductase iron-sulfur subunit